MTFAHGQQMIIEVGGDLSVVHFFTDSHCKP